MRKGCRTEAFCSELPPNLGGGYLELVCPDADGEPADKRIFFPDY